MAALSDYVTGTISLTNGQAAFTGTSTGWLLAGFKEGDTIIDITGATEFMGVVATIDANGAGTLTKAWEGPTLVDVGYRMRYQPDGARVSAQARNLIELLGSGAFFQYDASGTLAERAQYDGQRKGFSFLNISTTPMGLYIKASDADGDWAGPTAYAQGETGDTGPMPDLEFLPAITLAPGSPASVDVTPTSDGYQVQLSLPKGDTGDINGVTPFWVSRLGYDADAGAARTGLGVRDVLSGSRSFFVRPDGSDTNTGLGNTAGAAFLTIQRALLAAYALDLRSSAVTIQLADGTYTAGVSAFERVPGQNTPIVVQGNSSNPSAVVISCTNANAVVAGAGAWLHLKNLKMQTTGAGVCIFTTDAATVELTKVVFGASASWHMTAVYASHIVVHGNYEIAGSALGHMHITSASSVTFETGTHTVTGTPNFSAFFVGLSSGANVEYQQPITISGAATGQKFYIHDNAALYAAGQGLDYLPGNSAGVAFGGGRYTDQAIYNGKASYVINPIGGSEVVNAEQISVLLGDRALANASGFQALFGATEDTITLASETTYHVEAMVWLVRSAGTTNHTINWDWGGVLGTGGSATWMFDVTNPDFNNIGAVHRVMGTDLNAATLTAPNTSANEGLTISVRGVVRTGTGTAVVLPGLAYSAAPGGVPTLKANTFMRFWPIGDRLVKAVGRWS